MLCFNISNKLGNNCLGKYFEPFFIVIMPPPYAPLLYNLFIRVMFLVKVGMFIKYCVCFHLHIEEPLILQSSEQLQM